MSVGPAREGHLTWQSTVVDGRPVVYGAGGEGPTIVFLHGWGTSIKAYKRALRRLVLQGARVVAPAMPGFGGSADLPAAERSVHGYASWVTRFLAAVDVTEPVVLVGHSFGGGVSIALAHDYPEAVRGLVLVNSIGGSAWTTSGGVVRSMAQRPLWDWGIHFPGDVLPLSQVRRVLPVILAEALPSILRSPATFVKVADIARRADLTEELEELGRRKLPVVVLWGSTDRLITRASVEALVDALGGPEWVAVPGGHTWLMVDPDTFGEVMTNVVAVAKAAQALPQLRPTADSTPAPPGRRLNQAAR